MGMKEAMYQYTSTPQTFSERLQEKICETVDNMYKIILESVEQELSLPELYAKLDASPLVFAEALQRAEDMDLLQQTYNNVDDTIYLTFGSLGLAICNKELVADEQEEPTQEA